MIFKLVVVDTLSEAGELNRLYEKTNTNDYRAYAVKVNQILCGLQYKGARPNELDNRVTLGAKLALGEMYDKWYRECLLMAMSHEWRNKQ